MSARASVDLAALIAVDVHTHVVSSVHGEAPDDPLMEFVADVFGSNASMTLPEMAEYYRAQRMAFVAFTIDDVHRSGQEPHVTNLEIASLAAEHPDVVIPFGSVDPHRGAEAVRIADELIARHGMRGFKFHPSQQEFFPNDRACYSMYECLEGHRVPALFHSGITAVGRGQRGGAGIRLKFSDPLALDDVAADFPDLPIVIAHPSFPWQDQALAVALHKPNVYIDLSGWSPKYFPANLVQYMNTQLREKMLFGSDFPAITPERWLRDFDQLQLKPGVREAVLKTNAARLFDWSLPTG